MGCQCCRMIKSYIYDPSVAGDVRKTDSAGNSLYQPHHLPGRAPSGGGGDPFSGHDKQKQGFHNLAFSKSNDSTLKMEVDNNHLNQRLHAPPSVAKELHQQADVGLYIIQPGGPGPRWTTHVRTPSQVPVYPDIQEYDSQTSYGEQRATGQEWDSGVTKYATGSESPSAEEIETDEGVGWTPEYPCDTGDEGSVLSVDIHTSSTSLSSVEPRKTLDVSTMESGISVARSEDEEEDEEVQSVTDSMVAEALAALEAATAGEEFD